jgi:hypothetical protein
MYAWRRAGRAEKHAHLCTLPDQANGCRGTIALETIEVWTAQRWIRAHINTRKQTGEVMLEIPQHLMISPPRIFEDEEIGPIMRECQHVLRGDLVWRSIALCNLY